MSAPSITLLGATYSDVAGVTLPKQGGGTATFPWVEGSETKTANGTYNVTNLAELVVNVSGGGGASNFVMGTFTTGSTRNVKTGSFTIPYTGTGYLLSLTIFVKGGFYNNTSSGNTTWYNSKNRYDCGWYTMTKRLPEAPTHASNSAINHATVVTIYKNSTSSATTYTSAFSNSTYVFAGVTQAGVGTDMIKVASGSKTVYYNVGNLTNASIGFPPSTEMQYYAVYSS